ncbi:hypothetical protein I4U23_026042 [Adineta vaga]|nr:hypothetical protein I4U23_026042 [Adineta vaga]
MAASLNSRFVPDFVIVWLDGNVAQIRNNVSSKTDLANNANLNAAPTNNRSHDIDNFILRIDPNMNSERTTNIINNVLHMFTDREECVNIINQNLEDNKKVFLIVSGQMGAPIVRQMCNKLSDHIYVFCGRRDSHEWTDEYAQHLVVYDDETGVFAKVLSDIGIHYLQKNDDNTCSPLDAIEYLQCARQFFMRASRLDRVNRIDYLTIVDDALKERQESSDNRNKDNEKDSISQDAMDA